MIGLQRNQVLFPIRLGRCRTDALLDHPRARRDKHDCGGHSRQTAHGYGFRMHGRGGRNLAHAQSAGGKNSQDGGASRHIPYEVDQGLGRPCRQGPRNAPGTYFYSLGPFPTSHAPRAPHADASQRQTQPDTAGFQQDLQVGVFGVREFNRLAQSPAGIYRINFIETACAGPEPKVVGNRPGNGCPEG